MAEGAGLIGPKRTLDSTPLYDAVATVDTITLILSAIRGLLKAADEDSEHELRDMLTSCDEYDCAAKPQIDWDDKTAREILIDSRAKDARARLLVLDGRELDPVVTEASRLLATVVGQDLDVGDNGVFRIARRVAKDRVISTVDREARSRTQDPGQRLRRLQGSRSDRPRRRDHHRNHGHSGQRVRRKRGRWPHRRSAR